jgi:hypothetical protein
MKYCAYCKEPIEDESKMITVGTLHYHYDKLNDLNTCYFEDTIHGEDPSDFDDDLLCDYNDIDFGEDEENDD